MFSTKEGRVESIETVPDTENDPIKQPYYITNSHTAMNENKVQELQDVVIRFSGDSGDGMQLTGTLFSDTSALLGNGISTFPDYPAEIRAPQGTVAGVSGFQVHFGAKRQLNPGDFCDVLIAMNPAALKANRKWLKPGATVILDEDSITEEHLRKAGFATLDPIRELNLEDFNVVVPNITEMTKAALADSGLDNKAMVKCKNMFALGICFYLYNRPEDHAKHYLDSKFAKKNPKPTNALSTPVTTMPPTRISSPIHIPSHRARWRKALTGRSAVTSQRHGVFAPHPRRAVCPSSAVRTPSLRLPSFSRNSPNVRTSV